MMDVAKQRLALEAAIPVVAAAFVLQERLDRITGSLAYLSLMDMAERNGIAVGNFDIESGYLREQLAKFGAFMEGARR